jgi:hypothetical protein
LTFFFHFSKNYRILIIKFENMLFSAGEAILIDGSEGGRHEGKCVPAMRPVRRQASNGAVQKYQRNGRAAVVFNGDID